MKAIRRPSGLIRTVDRSAPAKRSLRGINGVLSAACALRMAPWPRSIPAPVAAVSKSSRRVRSWRFIDAASHGLVWRLPAPHSRASPPAGLDECDYTDAMFHPVVDAWFRRRFTDPTPVQAMGWPAIAEGRDVLLAAPTGSGKTLAAFLYCLDALVRESMEGTLEDRTGIVYVSPLKALSNDIRRNLEEPLGELAAVAADLGMRPPVIRTAVRTGDTTATERRQGAKRPPHVLVTTPESFYILLTSESGRRSLAATRTVIVDEIHAVAGDKRGAHLALSLERLEHLVASSGLPRPQRIGLSATIRPIETAARLLVGTARPLPALVDVGQRRRLDLAVEVLRDELGAVCTHEQWGEIYDRVAELARAHRSTLVFVNTRRLVERVTLHLAERLGQDSVAAHHSSLSRQRRFAAEQRLKSGELSVVVATASLELGIDVGAVDLTCLLGSPRSIATGLQRIGRSGHTLGATPKGRIFPLTRDQLVECAALVRAARRGEIDRISLRRAPLDVLAQQIVAACAAEPLAGDVILLGNNSCGIRRVESGKVRVEDAGGAAPSIPFWLGEGPARTAELSAEVAAVREEVKKRLGDPPAAARWLVDECGLDESGAALARDYIAAGRGALGAVPTLETIVAERFFDEAGGQQLVIHAPFGGRINRAWGMALRKRICQSFDFELQAAATDDGVLLSLGPQHSFPLESVFQMVHPSGLEQLLTDAALQAPMFATRWRWNATRSLALVRWQGGRRVPPYLQRMRAEDLLVSVFPAQLGCQDNAVGPVEIPDHPLVKETLRDCLTEAMDAQGLKRCLEALFSGKIRRVARETPEPSVFAHEILNANPYAYLDDAPLEDRRARAVT